MEELIEAVKKHECLWNPLIKEYRDGYKKESAWQSIVDLNLDIMGVKDIRTAKAEWKKLRDNHRESLKRQKNKLTPNKWRFAGEMDFLVPYMKSREKSSGNTEQYTVTEYEEKYSPATLYLPASHVSEDEEEQESKRSVQNELVDMTRKRRADTDITDVIKEIENVCHKQEKHPIEYFFESMAQTTKSLPIYLQNRIKKGVLDIVCQAEEEMESYNKTVNGNPNITQ